MRLSFVTWADETGDKRTVPTRLAAVFSAMAKARKEIETSGDDLRAMMQASMVAMGEVRSAQSALLSEEARRDRGAATAGGEGRARGARTEMDDRILQPRWANGGEKLACFGQYKVWLGGVPKDRRYAYIKASIRRALQDSSLLMFVERDSTGQVEVRTKSKEAMQRISDELRGRKWGLTPLVTMTARGRGAANQSGIAGRATASQGWRAQQRRSQG